MPLSAYGTERELADQVLGRLACEFEIEVEIPGRHCSGNELRIDAILRPRSPAEWRNGKTTAFGVEFKNLDAALDPSVGDYTKWIAQAVDYTHVDWRNHGRLQVFTCPGISEWINRHTHDPKKSNWSNIVAAHLLSRLGVNEIVQYAGYGLTLLGQGSHRLWSERGGVCEGRRWDLSPHVGSR